MLERSLFLLTYHRNSTGADFWKYFGSWSSVLPPIVKIFTTDYPVSLFSVWLKSFPYLSMSKSSFFSSWKNELLSICLTNLNLKSSSFGTPHPSVPRKSYCIFLLTAMVSLIHSQLIQCPVWTLVTNSKFTFQQLIIQTNSELQIIYLYQNWIIWWF